MAPRHAAWFVLGAACLVAAPQVQAGASSKQQLGCGPGSLLGGYQHVTLPSTDADYVANLALQHWLASAEGRYSLAACKPQADAATLSVLDACSQVVAGTNWQVLFEASIPCGGSTQNEQVVLEASIYQPLPYTNMLPNVTDVKRVG